MKKIFFSIAVFFMVLFSVNVYGAQVSVPNDDPLAGRQEGDILEGFYDVESGAHNGISLFSRSGYTHASKFDGYEILRGIDVSVWQGTINWNAVKASGVDFVIIRVGYRGYGESSTLKEDSNFRTNIQGALDADLDVGVYIYSQAITTSEAIEEAEYVLSRIEGYNITYPVVIDYEYASVNGSAGGRLYDAHLSRQTATDVCNAFCDRVANEGYRPMVYANKSMLSNNLYASQISSKYDIWLANYTTETDYEGDYTCWQYTSSGYVDGISGRVDMDFWYEKQNVYKGVDYSDVYDFDYYISHNNDVKALYGNNKLSALKHFVENGMSEGRQAKESFNVNTYKNRYADLRAIYGNDLKSYYLHYINYGKAEGRSGAGTIETAATTVYKGVDYAAVYDYNYYIANNLDVKAVYADNPDGALKHFVENGMSEGRQAKEDFNVYTYRNRYSDLRSAFGKDLKSYYLHYINYGKSEKRSGAGTAEEVPTTVYNGVDYAAVYDYKYYIANNEDVKSVYANDSDGALKHFVENGMSEARQAKEDFNVYTYRNRYSDLKSAFGNDWKSYYLHYINYGKSEGRSASGTAEPSEETVIKPTTVYNGIDYSAVYNFDYYIACNEDVKALYGSDPQGALRHFVEDGMLEGRQASEEFDVYVYKACNTDLSAAYGNDLKQYYLHYINYGKSEGRTAK